MEGYKSMNTPKCCDEMQKESKKHRKLGLNRRKQHLASRHLDELNI